MLILSRVVGSKLPPHFPGRQASKFTYLQNVFRLLGAMIGARIRLQVGPLLRSALLPPFGGGRAARGRGPFKIILAPKFAPRSRKTLFSRPGWRVERGRGILADFVWAEAVWSYGRSVALGLI